MSTYSQEDINTTFQKVSDVYLDYKEPLKSYMYIKGYRKVLYVRDERVHTQIILDFYRNVKDLCEKAPSKQIGRAHV